MEKTIGLKASKVFCSMQPGDVKETWASTSKLKEWIDYSPKTSLKDGNPFFDSFGK